MCEHVHRVQKKMEGLTTGVQLAEGLQQPCQWGLGSPLQAIELDLRALTLTDSITMQTC